MNTVSAARVDARCTAPARHQRGGYLVEFVIGFAVFMVLLAACIEVPRLLYTWSALTLATQRGARVAAVCPIDDASIAELALSSSGEAGSSFIPGVDVSNVSVEYRDERGLGTNHYPDIRYVTVSIVGYQHRLLIPGLLAGLDTNDWLAPSFSTTLPAESLGFDPDADARTCPA